MKHVLMICLLLASQAMFGQPIYKYVSAKSGLSIREKPDVNAKVIEKIPYGTRIAVLPGDPDMKMIVTEGMTGFWRKATYNNKTGYIIDSYLLPVAPPKSTVANMKNYLLQLSPAFGSKLVVKKGNIHGIEEEGYQLTKQLFKNGAEWHELKGYEYLSNTYFIPDLSLQQAFQVVRLIPEFKHILTTNDEFPAANKTIKKGEIEYDIKVETEGGEGRSFITKISIGFADGAVTLFEMFQLDNQVVIFYSSGV